MTRFGGIHGQLAGARRSRSLGQTLVEFSLAIPLFMLVFLAVAEGGYYAAATTIVSGATHEGARLGVLESTLASSTIRTRVVQTAAPIVSVATSAISLRLGRSNGDGTWQSPTDCDDTCYQGRKQDDRLVVTTSYSHRPLIGYVFPGITVPSDATAELTVEGDPV